MREAKEKADNCDKEKEEKETARKVHFESLFDDYQGMWNSDYKTYDKIFYQNTKWLFNNYLSVLDHL